MKGFWIFATFLGLLVVVAVIGLPAQKGGCDSESDTYTLFTNATATESKTIALWNAKEVSVQVAFTNATSPTVAIAGSADNGTTFATETTFAVGANGSGTSNIHDLRHKALTHLRVTVTKTDNVGVGARIGKVNVSAHLK